MKFKILIFVVTLLQVSQSFNVESWLKKYCVFGRNLENLGINGTDNAFCQHISLSKDELKDIQQKKFVISDKKAIVFKNGDFGTLNDRFFEKFPKSEHLVFISTKVQLGNLVKSNNVKILSFLNCEISGNENSNIFQHLPNLEELKFLKGKLDGITLNKKLLGNIPSLRKVEVVDSHFTHISQDVFKGSPNVEKIYFENNTFNEFSREMFSELRNLKELSFVSHNIQSVLCEILPKTIETLYLGNNRIEKLNFRGCKFTRSLKNLNLYSNLIQKLDVHTFDDLENIEKIDLGRNKLSTFNNEYIKNLKHLKWIGLNENSIPSKDLNTIKIPHGYKL